MAEVFEREFGIDDDVAALCVMWCYCSRHVRKICAYDMILIVGCGGETSVVRVHFIVRATAGL